MQHVSLLDTIRRALRQQSNTVNSVVSNLYGTTPGQIGPPEYASAQRWRLASVPAATLLDLDQFYLTWQTAEAPQQQVLEALQVPGTVTFSRPGGYCHLLTGGIEVPSGTLNLPLTIETETTHGLWAVYVNGTLQRRGSGLVTMPLSLSQGLHTIEIVVFAVWALVTVPPIVTIAAEFLSVPTPMLLSVTTSPGDPFTGATDCTITWQNDPKVGGVKILRQSLRPLATITGIGSVLADRTVEITLDGVILFDGQDVQQINAGQELYTRYALLGVVINAVEADDLTTRVVVRLAPDQDDLPPGAVGQLAWLGQWQEVGRQGRNVAGGTSSFIDKTVTFGERYEYTVQAWSVWNPNQLSPYATTMGVRAGDISAPGCAEITDVQATGSLLTFFYKTPPDEDYAGVNVYAELTRYAVVDFADPQTITVVPNDLTTIDDSLVGWTVFIDGSLNSVLAVVDYTITLASPLDFTPQPGDVVTFSTRTKLITDMGLPGSEDSLQVPMPSEVTTFEFRTFDKSRNEQTDEDLELCANARFVFVPGEFMRPTVYVDEVPQGLQQGSFNEPFNDPKRWAIVLLGAVDAFGGTEGVTIFAERKGGNTAVIAATTKPDFELTQVAPITQILNGPFVANATNSRYYALERTLDINWIVVTARDAAGNESREYYYATSAPYITMPEVEVKALETANEAILDLYIKDPDFRVAHTPLLDEPVDYVGVQVATSYGEAAYGAYVDAGPPAEVLDSDTNYARFRVTRPLDDTQSTKLAYRVLAVFPDGAVGQWAQGVIPYTAGAQPGFPNISTTFDADGTLILQLQGDSDTASLQWLTLFNVRRDVNGELEAQRALGGPWLPLPTDTELEVLFADRQQTDEVNGRFVEFDTGVTVDAGAMVWVSARGASEPLDSVAWPGRVTAVDGVPKFSRLLARREALYVAPKVEEHITEWVNNGQYFAGLTVRVTDPQRRLQPGAGVVFRRMPGTDQATWDPEPVTLWYSPGESSSVPDDDLFEYTAVVELFDQQVSRIAYAVLGEDERGDDDAILMTRTVAMGQGTVPMIPQVNGLLDAVGRFALRLVGDSDTVGFRYGIAVATGLPTPPSVGSVEASPLVTGRIVTTNTLATLAADEHVAVTVIAYNADNVASEPFQASWERDAVYMAPNIEEIVDESTDLVNGVLTAYGVLQLKVTDPQGLVQFVEFSSMAGNNPADWDREWQGTDWTTVWSNPLSVTPDGVHTTRYLYQVPLQDTHLSRILYRVQGVRPDGSIGVLFHSVVPFDANSRPTILELGGHIDAAGQYWPVFRGDSDCRSWILAAVVGTPTDNPLMFPNITAVESPTWPIRRVFVPGDGEEAVREYPDPDGTPLPTPMTYTNGDPLIVAPGRMLFVTAMALATQDGGAALPQYKSTLARYSVTRVVPYVPPTVTLEVSETPTLGTLTLLIHDPDDTFSEPGSGVFARRMTGRPDQWDAGYSAVTPFSVAGPNIEYRITVPIGTVGARIGYQVRARMPNGALGLVTANIISFAPGSTPSPPLVDVLVDTDGTVRARIQADSDTTHLKVAFSTVGIVPDGVVDAAIPVLANVGPTIVTWDTQIQHFETVYVGVRAINASTIEVPESVVVQAQRAAAQQYVRPTVLESLSETEKIGTLALTQVDPEGWLTSCTFKWQSGTGAWSSRLVPILDSNTVLEQEVNLVPQKTSRIQYELYGVRENGTTGLITARTVSFRAGATPLAPQVYAFISSSGQLVVEVIGDSDTRSAQIAIRKSDAALTKSDVLGLTSPPGTIRSVRGPGRILRWEVPALEPPNGVTLDPGEYASIGVVAFPDESASDADLSSEVTTLVVSRATAYIEPVIEATTSETATQGSLTLEIEDPQLHVEVVELRQQVGRASWTTWQTVWTRSGGTLQTFSINSTIALVEGQQSVIQYRLFGRRADSTTGTIVEDFVRFHPGLKPASPTLTVEVAGDNAYSALLVGDSDTKSFRYGTQYVSANASPTDLATAASALTLSSTVNGRTAQTPVLTPALTATDGTVLVVARAASGLNGLGELSDGVVYAVARRREAVAGVIQCLIRVQYTSNYAQLTVTSSGVAGAQVRLKDFSGDLIQIGGPLQGVWATSGTVWFFSPPPSGLGQVSFEAGNVTGYTNATDSASIPSVMEAAKPVLYIQSAIESYPSTSSIRYGVTVRHPDMQPGTGTLEISSTGLTPALNETRTVSLNTQELVTVTQPLAGGQPGRVFLRAFGTGFVQDVATIDVPPQAERRTLFAEERLLALGGPPSTSGYTLNLFELVPVLPNTTVQFRSRQSRTASWGSWVNGVSSGIEASGDFIGAKKWLGTSVGLIEGEVGEIEWRARRDGQVVASDVVSFGDAVIPAPPVIELTSRPDGSFDGTLVGDGRTSSFLYKVALVTTGIATLPDPTVGGISVPVGSVPPGATSLPTSNRSARIQGASGFMSLGQTVVVAVIAVSSSGQQSRPAYGYVQAADTARTRTLQVAASTGTWQAGSADFEVVPTTGAIRHTGATSNPLTGTIALPMPLGSTVSHLEVFGTGNATLTLYVGQFNSIPIALAPNPTFNQLYVMGSPVSQPHFLTVSLQPLASIRGITIVYTAPSVAVAD